MPIPRRIIQTARTRQLAPRDDAMVKVLHRLHPDWEIRFFDNAEVDAFIKGTFPEHWSTFQSFPRNIQKYDFFRYLAIYSLGGFYLDLDVLISTPLDPLLQHQCVLPFEEISLNRHLRTELHLDWEVGNYAFAAEAGHPFLAKVIENCARSLREPSWVDPMLQGVPRPFRPDFGVLNSTGPGLLTRTLAENPLPDGAITVLFPKDVCNPSTWHHFGEYGIHLMTGSWRSHGGFLRRRLAGIWENSCKNRLLPESQRTGPTRKVPTRPQPDPSRS